MASIELKNASASYFISRAGTKGVEFEPGAVGAKIIVGSRYLEIAALENVTLSIKSGERVGLIGMNGSGKSTLLKLCANALAVKSGSIEVEGRVSPQFSLGAGIKPTLSGRRNTELKCLYMGTPQRSIQERVEEIKELSDLGGYFELPISTYSAGMRSRFVMSLLRLVRAEILIMDEWIGTADATVSENANRLQQEVVQGAKIVVMASHAPRVLNQWTDRVIWLHRGKVRDDGPTRQIQIRYKRWMERQA
jgi:ABC-2 type transport system ATP-binding protein/lipopolysaccharide transport system ATP-binding protein